MHNLDLYVLVFHLSNDGIHCYCRVVRFSKMVYTGPGLLLTFGVPDNALFGADVYGGIAGCLVASPTQAQ